MLLAPLVAYDSSPIEDRQRLAWVRAQTVEMENAGGGVSVRILPETEPPPDVLLGAADSGRIPLVALVHQGVVAVVTKQIKVQSP